MNESPKQDDQTGWSSIQQHGCPHCGSHRLVPAVAEWEGDRYCLDCHRLVAVADGFAD